MTCRISTLLCKLKNLTQDNLLLFDTWQQTVDANAIFRINSRPLINYFMHELICHGTQLAKKQLSIRSDMYKTQSDSLFLFKIGDHHHRAEISEYFF